MVHEVIAENITHTYKYIQYMLLNSVCGTGI